MNIGENIKRIRTEKGMTQQELADKIGVKRAAVSKYEKNSVNITATQLCKIAAVLEVSVKDLLFINEISNMNIEELESLIETENAVSNLISEDNTSKQVIEQNRRIQEAINSRLQELGEDKEKLLGYYDKLNHAGKNEAIKRTQELTEIEKYTKPDDVENK